MHQDISVGWHHTAQSSHACNPCPKSFPQLLEYVVHGTSDDIFALETRQKMQDLMAPKDHGKLMMLLLLL
jgi:hypothetical protein